MRSLVRLCRSILLNSRASSANNGTCRRLCSAEATNMGKDTRDADFVEHLKMLQPSEKFKNSLNGLQTRTLNKILPEVEIFVYMGTKVPEFLNDEHWKELLKCENVTKRVSYLEHIALKQHRSKKKNDSKMVKLEVVRRIHDQEEAKLERGEMGYGAHLISLVRNPLRYQKTSKQVEGCRIWKAIRMNNPKIIFDLQYFPQMDNRDKNVLSRHMQYCVTQNFHTNQPFQLNFANVHSREKEWLSQTLGFYTGEYLDQTILPDISEKPPKSFCNKNEEIVYISRYARDELEGPLTADAYVIVPSMDMNKESLGAARKAKAKAFRLPLRRYIDWCSGPQYVPFPNLLRILREVYISNGDWKTALEANIAKRHLQTAEEREAKNSDVSRRKLRSFARQELISSIQQATGNT